MKRSAHGRNSALRVVGIIILVLVMLFSTGSLLFIHNLYRGNFPRFDKGPYIGRLEYQDVPAYAPDVVKFSSGDNLLTGYVLGADNTKGLVVLAPGIGEGTEHYLSAMLYFVDHGWRVFTFEYTGSYASAGVDSVGLPQSRRDLEAALAYIQSDASLSQLPLVLWGHSWGGYAVTAVLKDHSEVAAVAAIASFNSPQGLLSEQIRRQVGVLGYAEVPFAWAYQTLRFGQSTSVTAADGLNAGDTPVLVIHGSADEAVAYDGSSLIAQRERITNPNVVYLTCSTPGHNGHRNLLWSEAAVKYVSQVNQAYQALLDQYDGAVPEGLRAEFYAGVDRFRTSEFDTGLLDQINQFFENALPA